MKQDHIWGQMHFILTARQYGQAAPFSIRRSFSMQSMYEDDEERERVEKENFGMLPLKGIYLVIKGYPTTIT